MPSSDPKSFSDLMVHGQAHSIIYLLHLRGARPEYQALCQALGRKDERGAVGTTDPQSGGCPNWTGTHLVQPYLFTGEGTEIPPRDVTNPKSGT